jgi:hypothetical protein
MTIRVRNKKTWENEGGEFVEYVGKGSVLENPYTNGCRRKLKDQYKSYLTKLKDDSPEWKRIKELQELHETGVDLNLLCSCYPDPCHSNVISDAITGKIKPKKD